VRQHTTAEPLAQLLALLVTPEVSPNNAAGRSDQALTAEVMGSCALDTIQQEMERLPQGARRLAIQLRLGLDPQWLWAVLTDYANLSRFIPNLESSRQLWRRGNRVGLEQVGCQQFCGLRFSARVELELEEDPAAGELRFQMVRGDFRRFEGIWRIAGAAEASSLLYELTVQGRPGMPIGLIEQRLRDDLANNLRGVQQEAQRRARLLV
jgi:ribosome-associated toxin RatA of RatAB toxin-antitoxin module